MPLFWIERGSILFAWFTGENIMLAPRKVVTFKCSGKLREMVNGK